MADETLIKKLLFKPGYRSIVLNPPEGYLDRLSTVSLEAKLNGEFDFIQLFVHNKEEIDKMGPKAVKAVKREGVLWIAYPKGTSKIKTDISRDKGWDAVNALGFRVVSMVSLDNTWSAMRFRPNELVKK